MSISFASEFSCYSLWRQIENFNLSQPTLLLFYEIPCLVYLSAVEITSSNGKLFSPSCMREEYGQDARIQFLCVFKAGQVRKQKYSSESQNLQTDLTGTNTVRTKHQARAAMPISSLDQHSGTQQKCICCQLLFHFFCQMLSKTILCPLPVKQPDTSKLDYSTLGQKSKLLRNRITTLLLKHSCLIKVLGERLQMRVSVHKLKRLGNLLYF